jgi:ABC-type enterochelin transport system substrate-binding protein
VRRTAAIFAASALVLLSGCSAADAPASGDDATPEAAAPAEVTLAVADGSTDVPPVLPLEIAVTGG